MIRETMKESTKMLVFQKINIRDIRLKEFLSELLGTFILVLFNNASISQSVLTDGVAGSSLARYWAAGLGVTLGIMASGGISGGHINPAVTVAMAVWGKFPWCKVPHYLAGQYAGAFFASCVLYGVYIDALNHFEMTRSLTTAGIWATYPGIVTKANGEVVTDFLSNSNGFADQVVGTMALMICVSAINDTRNIAVPKSLIPLFVGLLVVNLNVCFSLNCACALNPARDLAPRIFTAIAGWDKQPFRAMTNDGIPWWWVPILAPHIGAILGAGIYVMMIEIHHPPIHEPKEGKARQRRLCGKCKAKLLKD